MKRVKSFFPLLAAVGLAALIAACQSAPAALRTTHLYTDLDGTLLDERSEIPEGNRRALARFRRAGGRVGIATGRTPDRALGYAGQIDADLPLIFANGAIVLHPDGRLLRLLSVDDPDDIRAICARIVTAGCTLIYTAHADPRSGETRVDMGVCGPPADPARKVVKLRARQCAEHDALVRELPRLTRGRYSVQESGAGSYRGVSIGPEGVDKGSALAFVLGQLGVEPARAAFIGDSGNDTPALRMLREAGGRCFAMQNATDDVLAACPEQTEADNEHCGVAEAVERLLH
ncbi:MAG: HAD family phosphatase [Deltaproteobacteria bacterium]|nr:HAD family phosphatase [Deltaproteobacteria bacterium]